MEPVARSRYLAYEPPSKELQERQQESVRRVRERNARQKMTWQKELTLTQLVELEKDYELVGQIKAAEAMDRVKFMRECYEREQEQELMRLVRSQPTSLEAVRLKMFLRPHPLSHAHLTPLSDPLSQSQRKRCEILVEDEGMTQ